MHLSHLLYKTHNLEETVAQFRQDGFKVEYGSYKNPHNALIYFSEGPYIELLEKAPVSKLTLWALKGIGQGQVAKRLRSWKNAPPGFFEICLETTTPHLNEAKTQMQQLGQRYFCTRSQRKDPQQRLLQWQLLFPHNVALPFIMTPFNTNPKPKDFTNPNGIRQIKQCTYNNTPAHLQMVKTLCQDPRLLLKEGTGITDVVYI